jgi:hypothetical protein
MKEETRHVCAVVHTIPFSLAPPSRDGLFSQPSTDDIEEGACSHLAFPDLKLHRIQLS